MTANSLRNDMAKFFIMGGVLLVCYTVWAYYRQHEINHLIDAKMADRWTATEMRNWAENLNEANPTLEVPTVHGSKP